MNTLRRLVKIGVGAGAAAVGLGLLAGPQAQAFASSGGTGVVGYTGWQTSLSGVTHQQFATDCSDVWKGPVTSDDGNGNVTASINSFSMSCDQGVSVAPNALPWSLNAHDPSGKGFWSFTIEGVDLNVTTAQGTCRYTGSLQGNALDQGYYLTGTLSRQSTGCGGDAQVTITDPFEVVGI